MDYLLERLARTPLAALGAFDSSATATLVAAQIQRIVSVRTVVSRGNVSLLDFGLPHVVEQGVQEYLALERYALRLTRLILQYEPRLLQPRTAIRKTGLALTPYQLVVTGSLLPDAEPNVFYFDVPMA